MLPFFDKMTHEDQEKTVIEIHGVNAVLGERLEDAGYHYAHQVLETYLHLDKDRERFLDWMEFTCGANVEQASECYQWLEKWYKKYL